MSLGERIKTERESRKISQQELADYLKVERSLVSKWENGKSKPSQTALKSMSELFGISYAELTGEEEISAKKDSALESLRKNTEYLETRDVFICTILIVLVFRQNLLG